MRTFDTVFGLAFQMGRSTKTKSGYEPAVDHLGRNFNSDPRLPGFAAALAEGYAKRLIILGVTQPDGIHSAFAIKEVLVHDWGVSGQSVEAYSGETRTTEENIKAIPNLLRERGLRASDCAVISNFRHLPRTAYYLAQINIVLTLLPAESVWLASGGSKEEKALREDHLRRLYGAGEFASDTLGEVRGIADLIQGTYRSFA